MPKLYRFIGIVIKFHSHEHLPVHVHAKYNNSEVKITFYTKNGRIIRTIYSKVKGKELLPKAKMNQLKKLIAKEKYNILASWYNFFVLNKRIKVKTITKQDLK